VRASRRRIAAGAAVVVVIAGAAIGWFHRRTQPDAVGPRFTEALLARRPGTVVDAWSGGVMRIELASGVYIDVRLRALFNACQDDRSGCSAAISAALDDVDRADRATREPKRAMLRPAIVNEASSGFSLGYVTEPLVGRFELRYALVNGLAATFVTSAIADRLHLDRAALKAEALAAQHAEPVPELDALPGSTAIFSVRSPGDPPALLLDRERMKKFATRLGTPRLYAAIPAPAALYLAKADATGAQALAQAMPAGGFDLLAYDVDAPDGAAMTIAPRTP